MARLLFVNRFYLPDQSATARMLSGIAVGLANAGHEVCVLTSSQMKGLQPQYVPDDEMRDGVRVVRVRSTARGGFSTFARLVDYLSFHVAATWRALELVRAGDLLIAKTDPPLLGASMAFVARRKDAVLVNWTQDLFPEVAIATGLFNPNSKYPINTYKVLSLLTL